MSRIRRKRGLNSWANRHETGRDAPGVIGMVDGPLTVSVHIIGEASASCVERRPLGSARGGSTIVCNARQFTTALAGSAADGAHGAGDGAT